MRNCCPSELYIAAWWLKHFLKNFEICPIPLLSFCVIIFFLHLKKRCILVTTHQVLYVVPKVVKRGILLVLKAEENIAWKYSRTPKQLRGSSDFNVWRASMKQRTKPIDDVFSTHVRTRKVPNQNGLAFLDAFAGAHPFCFRCLLF